MAPQKNQDLTASTIFLMFSSSGASTQFVIRLTFNVNNNFTSPECYNFFVSKIIIYIIVDYYNILSNKTNKYI